jgi:hypothetical protein
MDKDDIINWLASLPMDATVYIDEGGLTLRCVEDEEAYLEVGGEPR